jgi:glycosyltransferase involved in cell wall biosynthesis
MGRPGGDSIGYVTGQNLMRRAFLSAGIQLSEDAKIWLSYLPMHLFERHEGKINVLYTMWEAEDLPKDMFEYLMKADYVIVPSRNSLDTFKKAGYRNRIYICQHGIDTDKFPYIERNPNPQTFRVLWMGAPNIRKGYDLAVAAFHYAFYKWADNVELYMKSTKYSDKGDFSHDWSHKSVVDTRFLSREELLEVYEDSHVFLFPSRGEGSGLPPMEAMSTGLPVIAPCYTGMRDYMLANHSYPCEHTLVEVEYGCKTKLASPSVPDMVKQLRFIYSHLSEAL